MAYLEDYLRVIPRVERERIETLLKGQRELYEIKNLTEEQFAALVEYLAVEQQPVTTSVELTDVVDADAINLFMADVAIDLLHLFEEQNLLEGAAMNYDRIFSGVLDDIRKEVSALRRREEELWLENQGEDGLIVKSYGFDVAEKGRHAETQSEGKAYLFEDRDGRVLPEVEYERSYHQHYIGLGKKESVDRLVNEKGQVTAKVSVAYENTGSVDMSDVGYGVERILDKSDDTYYMHVVLDTQEATHKVPKHPDMDKLVNGG